MKNSFALESLSYSGRLVQASGAPVVGPVTIRADLAYTNATGSVLCSDEISNVALSKGVFHVKIDFDCSLSGKTLTQVLSQTPAGHSVAIQITDITDTDPLKHKAYSFQALHALPFATVASQLVQMGAGDGQFLKWNNTNKQWEPGAVSGATGGTVTNVTASLPLSISNGTSTPDISISQAGASSDGYLSSSDWNAFNSKQGSIAAGTAAQYYRGDKTWQTLDSDVVPEGSTNLYYTNARVLGLPITGFTPTAGTIAATDSVVTAFGKAQGQINSINTAAGNYLVKNSSDIITGTVNVGGTGFFTITNPPSILTDATNKQYVDTQRDSRVAKAGDTMSGVLTLDSDLKIKGGSNYVTVKGHATSGNYNLFLPQTAGTAGYVLSTDGSGNTSWVSPTVNSSSITDGSIVDADVSGSAAIAQSKIANLTTDLSNKQPLITAGSNSQYYRGDKTFVDFGTDVRGTALNSFAVGANSTILATDTTLGAFGKVQGQIDAINSAVSGKEPAISNPSDTTKYYRGDKSWQTLNGSTVANTANGNISATNVQSALNELDSEKQASITTSTALSTGSVSTSLQNGLNVMPFNTSAGSTGELRFYELTGSGSNYISLKAPDTLASDINYVLPTAAPLAGQVLTSTAAGEMSWTTVSAPVTSTFGRIGVVTAQSGDYTAAQITNTPSGSIAAINVQTALNELDSEKEPILINPNDTTKYYRGDKTWSTFATDAINSVLSTFTLNVGAKPAVTNADTVVGAFGKVQKYLNDINSDYVSKSGNNTVTGSFNLTGITSFIQVPTPTGAVVNEAANVQYVQNYVGGYGQWTKGTGANSGDIFRSTGNIGIGTTAPTVSLDLSARTDAIALPSGTSAQQPATPAAGWIRFNSTNSALEFYNGSDWSQIVGGGSAVNPAGMVGPFTMSSCPAGWLEANGTAVSRTTYASLFTAIGTTYGPGNGTTTFNLPDYRGYFLRGWSHGSGIDPDAASRTNRGDGTTGDNVGTKQLDQNSSHNHGVTDPGHNHNISDPGHGHSINDPGHGHSINDPGHGHSMNQGPWTGAGNTAAYGANTSVVPGNANTNGSYTGISINGSGTGISINGTGTGISIVNRATGISLGNSGGNETRSKNINVIYCISTATNSATTVASTGTGTANYVPQWTSTTALGNSPIAVSGSNVGIGTTSPQAALDVNGGIKVGTQSTCNAATEGTQRYNSTTKNMEFCNGTSWKIIGTGTVSETFSATGNVGSFPGTGGGVVGFTTKQNSNTAVFSNLGTSGIRILKAGKIHVSYNQDAICNGNYSYSYVSLNGSTLIARSLAVPSTYWSGLSSVGSYSVAANDTLTFYVYCASGTFTQIDPGDWSIMSIFWSGEL